MERVLTIRTVVCVYGSDCATASTLSIDGTSRIVVKATDSNPGGLPTSYPVDHVCWLPTSEAESKQETTYKPDLFGDVCRGILHAALTEGRSTTILVDGIPGSARTQDIYGGGGLLHCLCSALFAELGAGEAKASISMFESRPSALRDLLGPEGACYKANKADEHPATPVASPEEVIEHVARGLGRRTTGDTVTRLTLLGAVRINLVESCAVARPVRPTDFVLRRYGGGMSALFLQIVTALVDLYRGPRKIFVPYRNSPVTWYIRQELHHESHLVVVALVSSSQDDLVATRGFLGQLNSFARHGEDLHRTMIRKRRAAERAVERPPVEVDDIIASV